MEQHDISTHDADPQETIDRLAAELADCHARCGSLAYTVRALAAERAALAAELAALRATMPEDAAGLLWRGMIAMGMVADRHSEIYGDEHEMTVAMRQDRAALQAWASRLDALAGEEE